ncbi:MAG: hypothetical protein ISS79_05335 [Phycisphaerae bacterium]|nr:hypothetical protein [Phycisphaerae bacterium]
MDSSKTEKRETDKDSKVRKKSRLRKLAIWLLVDLGVAALVIILLLYRPGRYNPLSSAGFKPGEVSPYLTDLSAAVYNGAQLGEPFDVVVSQEAINDMIARGDWPKEEGGVMLYAPAAVLEPGIAVLMATANVKGMEFIVTIELEPKIDEQGLLILRVAKLKVGAMNITPLAKMIAKKMYADQIAARPIDTEAWQTKIVASLLNDEPFEPIFSTGENNVRVRVGKVAVQKEKVRLQLIPVQ